MQKRIIAVAMCLITLITLVLPCTVFGAQDFTDVSLTASYYKAVDELSGMGVLNGRGDGTFDPNGNITRAEFCATIARANDFTKVSTEVPFTDVDNHWAKDYIAFCYDRGYVNGVSETEFAPNDKVTYEQAVKMIVCAAGLDNDRLAKVGPYWYSGYIMAAKKNNLLAGTNEILAEEVEENGQKNRFTDIPVGQSASRAFVAQATFNSMVLSGDSKNVDATDFSSSTPNSAIDNTNVAIVEDVWEPETEEELERVRNAHEMGMYESPEEYEEDKKAQENTFVMPDETEIEDVYVPSGDSSGKIVVIDAGHNYSNVDTGAVGNGLKEQDITFYIAEKLKPMLERNGFTVVMTRNHLKENVSTESVSASLRRRAQIANNAGADLFISIHCNAGGGTGTETYYCTGKEDGKVFASFVQNGMLDAIGLRDRGVKNARYSVLKNTNMTAILVETGFIDNSHDAQYLADDTYRELFAEGIARGVCNYIGVEFK